MFGDWQLVLVVYNWGEGLVQCVVNCNFVVGLLIDFNMLLVQMFNEICNYVFKLQVVKNIIVNLVVFDIVLFKVDNQFYFVIIGKICNIDVKVVV